LPDATREVQLRTESCLASYAAGFANYIVVYDPSTDGRAIAPRRRNNGRR